MCTSAVPELEVLEVSLLTVLRVGTVGHRYGLQETLKRALCLVFLVQKHMQICREIEAFLRKGSSCSHFSFQFT